MEQSKSYVPPATFGTEQALIKKSLAQATKDNDFLVSSYIFKQHVRSRI